MKKYASYIFLSLMILIITGSALWSPGNIALLDYVLTPHATISWFDPLIFPVLNCLSVLLGTTIVSKGFFVMILMLAAYLGVLFARYIAQRYAPEYRTMLEIFGGVFFLVNPYAYERMMVQPTIYMGTITLGYMVYFLLLHHPTYDPEQDISSLPQKQAILSIWQRILSAIDKRYIWAGIFGGLSFIMMPHASYMLALILWLYTLLYVRTRQGIVWVILASCIILMMNLNWILAPLFGHANSAQSISTFSTANLEAFETQALAPLDVWWTNILLYGFWWEKYSNHYANVDFLSSLWWVGGLLVVCLSLYGFYAMWRAGQKNMVSMLSIIALLSLVFAIGIASPVTAWLTRWMIEYVPLWQGYREPQKWVGLIMIVEGITFLCGLSFLLQKYGRDIWIRISLIVSVALILLIWSPGPLMGYHGQLRTTVYPEEFETLRQSLLHPIILPSHYPTILALPWHSYIGCSWMWRPTISNPIKWLLSPLEVVSSDNIEVTDILYSNSVSPTSVSVEKFMQSHLYSDLMGTDITGILLMKWCANSDSYTWLDTIAECQKRYSSSVVDYYTCS